MSDGATDLMVSTPNSSVANFDESSGEASEVLDENGKPMIRWAPLGANDGNETCNETDFSEELKLQNIMEEHEILNTALLSLTSHFAQQSDVPNGNGPEKEQKCYVPLIIDQLKTQLDDLEQFAYKSGEISHPPTLNMLEKQKILLDELEQRLNLNVHELQSMSEEEIRGHIDAAITQSCESAHVVSGSPMTSAGTNFHGCCIVIAKDYMSHSQPPRHTIVSSYQVCQLMIHRFDQK
ncbi:unnamed protein product [Dibothriocephalus latus]|uniref:RUN domain-containing protein n=1 Tax=Dibothriocephalus latus TaxID=60516 RepID=A0A3P7L5P7_DIBLA|nr:unnamed protein product [Dibothriocephalus latus]